MSEETTENADLPVKESRRFNVNPKVVAGAVAVAAIGAIAVVRGFTKSEDSHEGFEPINLDD